MLQSEVISGDMDDLATDAHAVGSTIINVTSTGAKTFAPNELAGGYVIINSGTTGAGITYRIKGNPQTSATAQFTIDLVDAVYVAFHANTTATVMKNPWMDVVIAATGTAHMLAGVSNVAVPAGDSTAQFFWCQTWGVAAVAHDDVEATGTVLASGANTAGQVEDAGVGEQIAGINLFTSVADDFNPTFLTIAP
jgi:hypothetical protein